MKVTSNSYNVLKIDLGNIVSGQEFDAGDKHDFELIKNCINKSGMILIEGYVSGAVMRGTLFAFEGDINLMPDIPIVRAKGYAIAGDTPSNTEATFVLDARMLITITISN